MKYPKKIFVDNGKERKDLTLVRGNRCPVRENFSGGLGIHSEGVRFPLEGASIISFSAADNLDSSSMTFF